MAQTSGRRSRMFTRKSIEALQAEAVSNGLKRTLGSANLVFLGIGCILGAGIYVMTGNAAANFAGPAVLLSFLLAGAACALTGLCYAELAAAIPVSGSSYSYCYAAAGELLAWILGWLLLLEYGLAAATLAVGFSGYFASLLHGLGFDLPAILTTPFFVSDAAGSGLVVSGAANAIAALAIFAVTAVLVRGVSESAAVNNLLVIVKIAVLALFVIVGLGAVHAGNWHPFVPAHEGGFRFGWPGIVRAASILFFAYIGFETVSTAAAEARDPQRDLPIGILGSLVACTLIYIVVAAVLTGVVPFRELGVSDPIAVAVDRMGHPALATLVKIGALMGLSSVLLVNAYGQSRIGFAMGRDGLLPELFCRLHPRFRTPSAGTILFGAISAMLALLFPIALLGDLVSLGVGLAFSIVALSVMWLRTTRPDLPRPFRVPLGGIRIRGVWIGFVPVGAILMCWAMIIPVVMDVVQQAASGHIVPAVIIGLYAVGGVLTYVFYGLRASRVPMNDALECSLTAD